MNTRMLALAACLIVLVTVVLLAPSLGAVRFEPARPVGFEARSEGRLVFPALSIPEDTPLWKILAWWLVIVVNLALVLLMLSPELRKRILRQLIRFALGVLLFLLLLRYRVLQWPQTELDPAAAGSAGPSVPAPPLDVPVFQPPQVAGWVTYAVSLLLLWFALLGAFLVYRAWQRHRSRRLTGIDDIAGIARASLAELAEGRHWNDVVVRLYARMNEAVWIDRGLHRESSATPREFAARLSGTGLPASSVEELTRLFETARYGDGISDAYVGQRAAACPRVDSKGLQGNGMKFARLSLLVVSIILSAVLAFAARDLVYGMLVLPVSYLTWQLGILFRAVPQLVWWTAVVVTIALVLGWQLVPEIRPAAKVPIRAPTTIGDVGVVARWLRRSRRSTYFKWQLAHRLGRVSRKLIELGGRGSEAGPPNDRVEAYIAAGMNNSFVDFPPPRHPLARPRITPLDVDPGEVVDYLESQSLMNRGNDANRL